MAISSLLRRMGFLKLGDYGLILTPEGRVLSTHFTVLDDGLGGKIVGWREGDLAAMELDHWRPAPATPRATANPRAIPPAMPAAPPLSTGVPAPVATVQSSAMATAPLGPKRAPTPIPLETQPMIRVDVAPEPLEDEWEWEIAVARARAQAEWAAEAAASVAPAPPPRVRAKSPSVQAAPIADRWDTSDRTKTTMTTTKATTAPLPRVVTSPPTRPVQAVPPVSPTGRTVIPVPTLPQVTARARIQTGAMPLQPAPRRFPRATPQPELASEDTQVTHAAPTPANDDLTSPGLVMPPPPSSSSSSTGSTRVAAKQR